MPGLIEFVMFFVGTAVVSYTSYLFGVYQGRKCQACKWMKDAGFDMEALTEGFDDRRVDIVCNQCGLVGEFECAACCPPVEEE